MLIKHIKASGLLSFGPKGISLPMRKLNVLIGPNGSGKSNLLEVINLFKECVSPNRSLAGPVMDAGGIDEWLWKGDWHHNNNPLPARIECVVAAPDNVGIRHGMEFYGHKNELRLADESIAMAEPVGDEKVPWWFYHMNHGDKPFVAHLHDRTGPEGKEETSRIDHGELTPGASILTQLRAPGMYRWFRYLETQYSSIQMHRDWSFGPSSQVHSPARADARQDTLGRAGQNLAVMVAAMKAVERRKIVDIMQALYPSIRGVHSKPVTGGSLQLYLEEEGGAEISASRLSDGTLRFLSLLVILLSPTPAPLIVIEEPELGLHPDVSREVARLLIEASERTQIVVTTHSRLLVDYLGDDPESIIVCDKQEGESVFQRLDGKRMKVWLEDFSLGELWSKGELGGNRW